MFKNLSDKPVAELQLEQADKWDETGLLRKTIEARNGQPTYVFYEGPPTANGKPGIHHAQMLLSRLRNNRLRRKVL